jgi:hypothetical protein
VSAGFANFKYQHGTIIAVLMIPIGGPFAVLPLLAIATGIPKLNEKLVELVKKQKDLGDEQTQLQRLISSAKILKTQLDNLLDVMKKALTALDHLQGLFQHQAEHLEAASRACRQALKALPDDKSSETRRIFLQAFLRNAPEAWEKVCFCIGLSFFFLVC